MSRSYAAGTDVTASKSREEIERTLARYGADQFGYGWDVTGRAAVTFRANDRSVRFVLEMPDRGSREFTKTETGRDRSATAADKAYEQAARQRWRALALVVKAKLEAIDAGISTFEAEFLANVVLPDGSTVGEFMAPQIADVYRSGQMPSMMPALEAGT